MKKRRTIIISLLLVAALCLSVGYALTTDILSINGTAKSEADDLEVVFQTGGVCKIVDGSTPEIKAASMVGDGGDIDISFHAYGLKNANEFVTAEFVIVNNNTFEVTLEDPDIVSPMHAFDWELIDWAAEDETLAPDATATFRVKVWLKAPSPDIITETFTININASAGTAP